MSWDDEAIERLSSAGPCGYSADGPPSAEPTALAAIALLGAGRGDKAKPHLQWLADNQINPGGSVPPLPGLGWPGWTTPLAIVAAVTSNAQSGESNFRLSEAKQWLLSAEGKKLENVREIGHDGTLIGWPWVLGTHSWQEPTAWSVLALKSLGLAAHARTREGVRLLVDRLLPTGGCNYGNTYVLGQRLRAHLEPSGLALMALAGESSDDPRIPATIGYVAAALSDETTPVSLSYGLMGLTAHRQAPASAAAWLAAAYARTIKRQASPLTSALLVLAAQGEDCPLITQIRTAQK
jgi:hypothetical protein